MTLRRIKGNSLPWCSFCDVKTTRARWRSTRISDTFACGDHKADLQAQDTEQAKRDSHMSEGEWEAYGKWGY